MWEEQENIICDVTAMFECFKAVSYSSILSNVNLEKVLDNFMVLNQWWEMAGVLTKTS